MKRSLILVLLIALLVVMAGCAPKATPVATEAPVVDGAPAPEDVTIGFIPMTLDNEYFITMVNAAQQEADKLGVELLVQAGTSHGSAEEQLQIVETMITNKVDAICIVPSSSVGLMTALKKAEEAGIPVINLDTALDSELVKSSGLKPVPFIGTNNYDGAKLAGEYALEITGGTGKVAILTGIAGQQNAADRRNGFFDVVDGKLEVVAEASADWEVEKGYNAAQNMIQANPDLVLIFASNDNMALGAIRAAKEAGKDIKVIGYDAIGEALNSVKAGEMASTIAQFPAEMGIQGVQAAMTLLAGGTMPEYTYTETRPITSENVEEFMKYLDQFKSDEPAAEAEAPAEPVTIGFIPMTLDNEYFITMVNAAQQEADKSGVELLVQAGTSHGSAEEQLQIVETMITNKVDAICIVPSSSVGLMTALKKAEEAGIPVINLDTALDSELVKSSGLKPVPFIGTNNYDGAKLAGEYALEITGGTGKVAILTGIAGQQNAADRRNGFFDVVDGKLEVVAEASADWEVEKGYNAAQNMIQANPDLVLIFASNDNMALGAIRAAKEAGKDIKVIGYDAIGEALNSVKAGEMASTIAQFPAEMGIQGVQAALTLLGGGTMPDYTYTETRPITSENVEEFMTYLAQFK